MLLGCGSEEVEATPTTPLAELLRLPSGFPEPQVPESNPLTEEKIALGRFLFYDTRLSGNGTQSCASCHQQRLAFSDGRKLATGSTGTLLHRNSQGLTNVAYNANLTWASSLLDTIEQQVLIPLFAEHPVELGATGHENEILERLRSEPLYRDAFASAYPELQEQIDWPQIIRALASFNRILISGNSPFDRFTYQGQPDALSESAKRGAEIFFSETTECHHCHGGFNFTLSSIHADSAFEAEDFHNTGLYNLNGQGAYPASDTGLFEVTEDPRDMGKFRAPSLRNVAVTAPYMHDGSIETLEEVVRVYEAGGRLIESGPNAGDGRTSPLKSGFVQGFRLSDAERQDLIAFLESLTDPDFLEDPRLSNPFEP